MRKIRWGVLGTAKIAQRATIPSMQRAENCELFAIAGRNPEKAKAFQEEFGFRKAYGSYAALLEDPEVEAVYIPLPNDLHCEWTLKALRAGKHVLCEKPLAPTVTEMEEMIRTAEENHVILMEAFAYLHTPFTKAIKEELDRNAIGDILYMESAFITWSRSMDDVRMHKDLFGGCAYDLGCYNTSQILWMFGEEPETVQAIATYSPEGVDLFTSGLLTFRSGKRASFQCGFVLAPEDRSKRIDRFQIHGTKGFIKSEAEFNQTGELSYILSVDGNAEVKTVPVPKNYELEIEQMGRCIISGEQPLVSHDFTLMNGRVTERVLESIGY